MALLETVGKVVRSKAFLGAVTAGAVVKGLSDSVGKSAIDNAMEIAFDNKEADRAVLGTDLTPSLMVAEAGLGPISSLAKGRNLTKYGIDTGIVEPTAGGAGLGAGFGALGGALLGAKRGVYGGIAGGILGAIGGGVVGGAMGGGAAIANAAGYANDRRQLLAQSPFSNSSMMTADALNASGDIVFGMHNTRRG